MKASRSKKANVTYMIMSVILCSFAMCVVDAVIQPQYFVKSLVKLVLFLGVPLLYLAINRGTAKELRSLFTPSVKSVITALVLGVGVYAVIVGGYFALRGVFDFSGIVSKLTADTGVDAGNFLYVSLYISFVNSLLEEFFFRGFAFIILGKVTNEKFSCVFSALLFALYHGGMTLGYFNFGIFALTLFALFVAGLLFNFLNSKGKNIYVSWLVHMFANFAINTVGMILFGIL